MDTIGNTFTVLESVDSTNNYAMAKVHAGLAKHGDVFFSGNQTAGRGQRGKAWQSGHNQNIALSCVIEPALISLNDQFLLSMTIALSCYDLVNRYCKSSTTIKWPNDIYWRDRKAGGILIENMFLGSNWQYSVAGIGINTNQTTFSSELLNPVSLKEITGNTYDIVLLAKELCECLERRLNNIQYNSNFLLTDYNNHLYKSGQNVTLKTTEGFLETQIKGVNVRGQLLTSDITERIINWGEVEWLR